MAKDMTTVVIALLMGGALLHYGTQAVKAWILSREATQTFDKKSPSYLERRKGQIQFTTWFIIVIIAASFITDQIVKNNGTETQKSHIDGTYHFVHRIPIVS